MAKLALVYGMRLFPEDELGEVSEAIVTLKDGRKSRVTQGSSTIRRGWRIRKR